MCVCVCVYGMAGPSFLCFCVIFSFPANSSFGYFYFFLFNHLCFFVLQIEKPLQRHGGRLEHNETYCGSCFGAETVRLVICYPFVDLCGFGVILCIVFYYDSGAGRRAFFSS